MCLFASLSWRRVISRNTTARHSSGHSSPTSPPSHQHRAERTRSAQGPFSVTEPQPGEREGPVAGTPNVGPVPRRDLMPREGRSYRAHSWLAAPSPQGRQGPLLPAPSHRPPSSMSQTPARSPASQGRPRRAAPRP